MLQIELVAQTPNQERFPFGLGEHEDRSRRILRVANKYRVAGSGFSSIGPEDEARIINWLAGGGHCRDIAGLAQTWYVEVSNDFHPDDLRRIDAAFAALRATGS